MNLYDFLLDGSTPDAVAVIDEHDRQWTYAQLESLATHLAGYLEQATAEQDRCLIYADNSVFWLCSYLACVRAGRVAVPIPHDGPFTTLELALRSCAPRVAFVDSPRSQRLLDGADESTLVICRDASERDDVLSWAEVSTCVPTERCAGADEGTVATILFTSGTSDRPHGAVLSHHNLAASTRSLADYLRLGDSDRTAFAVSLSTAGGLSSALAHLRVGATLVLDHVQSTVDPTRMLSRGTQHAITGMVSTSDTLLMLQERAGTGALPTLRYIEHVGGKAPAGLVTLLQRQFPKAAIHAMYALAEAGGVLAAVPSQLAVTKAAAIGEPLPGVSLAVVDHFGHVLPAGQTGEIVAESQSIARGYWQEPELSRKVFRHGQFCSGDLGALDADGQLHLSGRVSHRDEAEAVLAEIEHALAVFPGLRELAVLTRHDEVLGEALVLVAVHPRGEEIRQQLLEFAAANLPFSRRPHEVHFRSHLPRNSAGRIDRAALQEEISLEKHVLPVTDQLQAPGESLQA